jgi:ribosomal protein L20A (L18A)
VLGKFLVYYGEVLSNKVVDYDGIKSEYFYRLNSGRLNFVDDSDSDIDLVNNFIIRNRNEKDNYGKSDYITTSFYLAVKFKPGLIIGTQLGDYVINKDDNSKHKFHIDLSDLMKERARSIESIYYYTSGDIELKMYNQNIKEIGEIEPLFQDIKINRLYC